MSLQLLSPFVPVDRSRIDDFEVGGINPVGEQDEIVACPARIRRNDAVKAKEISRIPDRLGSSVKDLAVPGWLDTERDHCIQISKPESLRSSNLQAV